MHPIVQIFLQVLQTGIQSLPKRHLIKLVQYRFMEAFTNAIGLRRHRFSLRVINIIDRQTQLVIVLIDTPTILCPSVGQDAQHR